jgi:hypothetical protein
MRCRDVRLMVVLVEGRGEKGLGTFLFSFSQRRGKLKGGDEVRREVKRDPCSK